MTIDPRYTEYSRKGWLRHQEVIQQDIDTYTRRSPGSKLHSIQTIATGLAQLDKLKAPGYEANPHLAPTFFERADVPAKMHHYVKAFFKFINSR